jgi:hypothetical protein
MSSQNPFPILRLADATNIANGLFAAMKHETEFRKILDEKPSYKRYKKGDIDELMDRPPIVPPIVWTKNLPNIDTESRNSFCYVDF